MPRRNDRLIFRSPSPGIPILPEPTSPPPPPRIERFRPLELPSRSVVTNLNERLASALSANSSLYSPIRQTQQQRSPSKSSSSPSSPSSTKSSSSPSATNSPTSSQHQYESWLYHLYDTTDTSRATTPANQTFSGWDILRASSDTSDTSSQPTSITPVSSPRSSSPRQPLSPPQRPSKPIEHTTSPHRRSSQPSLQYTSTSPRSQSSSPRRPPSSPHRPSSSSSSTSQSPRKMRACQTKHVVGSDRKNPKYSTRRLRQTTSMIGPPKYSSSTTVESDTSEEEIQWMSRLRPRHNNSNSNGLGNKKKGVSTGKRNVRKSTATPKSNRMESNAKSPLVKKQRQSAIKTRSAK